MNRWNLRLPERLDQWPSAQEFRLALSAVGGTLVRALATSPWVTVDLPAGVDPLTLPGVQDAERTQNLFPASLQVIDMQQATSWAIPQLGINQAHQITRGEGVTIAVLDSGWAFHPRLASADIRSAVSVVGAGVQDNIGHGTAILGVMASQEPDLIGVAPGATYHVIKVIDEVAGQPVGDDSSLAQGIEIATQLGVDLINGSLGQAGLSSMVEAALTSFVLQGGVAVFAAGNFGDLVDFVLYPASSPLTIGVGAVDQAGQVPAWSSWGAWPFSPDCVAPGVDLPLLGLDNSTFVGSGTSTASPFVTGSLALSISVKDWNVGGLLTDVKYGPSLAARTVLARQLLRDTSTSVSATRDRSGYGRLSTLGLLNGTAGGDGLQILGWLLIAGGLLGLLASGGGGKRRRG